MSLLFKYHRVYLQQLEDHKYPGSIVKHLDLRSKIVQHAIVLTDKGKAMVDICVSDGCGVSRR